MRITNKVAKNAEMVIAMCLSPMMVHQLFHRQHRRRANAGKALPQRRTDTVTNETASVSVSTGP